MHFISNDKKNKDEVESQEHILTKEEILEAMQGHGLTETEAVELYAILDQNNWQTFLHPEGGWFVRVMPDEGVEDTYDIGYVQQSPTTSCPELLELLRRLNVVLQNIETTLQQEPPMDLENDLAEFGAWQNKLAALAQAFVKAGGDPLYLQERFNGRRAKNGGQLYFNTRVI